MPSLDRAGPKNGEPYGVWQFKRTATMYCCMQWVIALSFLGNAAYDLFLLYFVEGDEWVLIYAKNISGEILVAEAPAIVLEHAAFMVLAAIVEIVFFVARLRVRRWADQGRARHLIALASGLMSIIVLIFEIRVITVEPIVRTIYSPIAMVLVALTIGTLGLPLKGQIALLLTYATQGVVANVYNGLLMCDLSLDPAPTHPFLPLCVPRLYVFIVPITMLQATSIGLIVVYVLETQARALYVSSAAVEARAEAQAEIAGYVFHELRNDQNAVAGVLEIVEERQVQLELADDGRRRPSPRGSSQAKSFDT